MDTLKLDCVFQEYPNGGHEWFAARRKGYYALTFHGRLTPEWMNQCFEGQLGFGGGILCQLTVPGKGPVLASTLHGSSPRPIAISRMSWPRLSSASIA